MQTNNRVLERLAYFLGYALRCLKQKPSVPSPYPSVKSALTISTDQVHPEHKGKNKT